MADSIKITAPTSAPLSFSGDEALKEPTRPVTPGFQILLGLANAGAIITLIPVLAVLIPAQVTQIAPANSAASLALVLALGAAGALVGNPLAGALSDRTTARLGRRRPWLLVGMAGSALGLLLLANSRSITALAAGWVTTQFFGNVLLAAYGAVMPDRVPVAQRGATQAIIGLSSPLAVILSDVLFTQVRDMRAAYYPIIAAMVLLTVLFVLRYREPQLAKGLLPPLRLGQFLASFWVSPRKYPNFARMWVMWLLVWLGYTLGTGGYFFLYVQKIIRYESLFPGHLTQEGMAILQILQIAVGVPLMMAAGVLSDRVGRRKIFVTIGVALIAAGYIVLIFSRSWPWTVAASVTIGAGFWIFYSLGLAMVSQLLPSAADRGKDLGVMNIAATLPQIVMPPIGAAILHSLGDAEPSGYQTLFIIGAVSVFLSIALLRSVRNR